MAYNANLEAEVIRRFVVESKRDRYLGFIAHPKNRQKFINDLHHMHFLQRELFDRIAGSEYDVIEQRLRALPHINTCYVISEASSIDGQNIPIAVALPRVIGADMGSLLVFGNAEVVYAEAEGLNLRWISKPWQRRA